MTINSRRRRRTVVTNGKIRVVIDGKTWGTVRRARPLETVSMAGRSWVALDRDGRKVPGEYRTMDDAARALEQRVFGPLQLDELD